MRLSASLISVLQAESNIANPAWFLASAVILALIPVAVGLLTTYVKISIVLGIIKNALGTQHAPSAMVTLALSLALTGLSMNLVINQSLEAAKGIDSNLISQAPTLEMLSSLQPITIPWQEFLRKNCGHRELMALSLAIARPSEEVIPSSSKDVGFTPSNKITSVEEAKIWLLIPAFLLTELKEGFAMAFIVLLPFLAIDLIVSNILMGLGMMMVSPVLISLPIKLVLFVISDSWLLIAQGLIRSYQI